MAAFKDLKDVASLILETGMRPEEVYRIRVENVHFEQSFLFNPDGKTRAAKRRIPLNRTALEILKRRAASAEGVYLFLHRRRLDAPMVKANNAHSRALVACKVRPFRLYDLRHTSATRAAQAGMDLTTLAALLGHSKLNMVMRYAHPQEEHQSAAVRLLEAANAAKQIAEFESSPTISTTRQSLEQIISDEKSEEKTNQIN